MPDSVRCSTCCTDLSSIDLSAVPKVPCDACGSTERTYFKPFSGTISFRPSLGYKQRRSDKKRPVTEGRSGWKLGGDGRWVKLARVVDRGNNRYMERVVDEYGSVEVEKDEPLDQHRTPPGK